MSEHPDIKAILAANDSMAPEIIPEFREYLDKRGQSFLEEIDDWLTKHAPSGERDSKNHVRIGIGLYAIEEGSPKEKKI